MSQKRIMPQIVVWLLTAMLLITAVNIFLKQNIADEASLLLGFVKEKQSDASYGENMINCYMPVVGYVASHYVDTTFLKDPSYTLNTGEQESTGTEGGNEDEKTDEESQSSGDELQEASLNLTPQSFAKLNKGELLNLSTLLKEYYTVTSITELTEKKFNVSQALEQDFTIVQDASAPQILIFHTHSQEGFADSIEGDMNTSIVAVGARLAQILSTQYGYSVIHDTSVYDYVDGVLDRSKAYTYAEQGVQKILEQYPTVEVVLDIHRDGVDDSVSLVTEIDGRKTARFMLFNGISYTKVNGDIQYLSNPYVQDNLALSLQMYLLGKVYYPDLLRKNYINGYRYCLHLRPKSMLIEVGAQNNTLEEEFNAMIPLADLLNRVLTGEKAYE
jgi:stage II sporulation protein P